MFKKLRDKITEEVQQTSLRLPVSVQQLSQLSPFSGSNGDNSEPSKSPTNDQQDELLMDISDIQPAGDNKSFFSIDEDSTEGTPVKSTSEFQVIELADDKLLNCPAASLQHIDQPHDISSGAVFHGTRRRRKSSEGSSISEVSGLFPIYEVPSVSFGVPQSDLESCSSEWEDGSASLDRLSKDTVYQAYLRVRQRYHKYKGRYSDIVRAYQEKERETSKLRDVLTKTQDKAMRRVSELREQCSLEQQAKAHLEQELRSDLEEKDHKISALQTKVKLLQEGCMTDIHLKPNFSALENEKKLEEEITESEEPPRRVSSLSVPALTDTGSNSSRDGNEDADNVSVGSLGSISTAPASMEAEEYIEKLKADIGKHKTLLSRCLENIRTNKEKLATLSQEKDEALKQLQKQNDAIELMKSEHVRELDSLKSSVESSALSMAETKQQLFNELQRKEAEADHFRRRVEQLEEQLEETKQNSFDDEEICLHNKLENSETNSELSLSFKESELKCSELEKLVTELQDATKNLEIKSDELTKANIALKEELTIKTNEIKRYENHTLDHQSLMDESEKLQLENISLKEELNNVKLTLPHSDDCSEVNEFSDKITNLIAEKSSLESIIGDLNNKIGLLTEDSNTINELNSNLKIQIDENDLLKKQIIKHENDTNEITKTHNAEIEEKNLILQELNTKLTAIEERCQKLQLEADEFTTQITKFNEMEKKMCTVNTALETKDIELANLKDISEELKNNLIFLGKEKENLEVLVNTINSIILDNYAQFPLKNFEASDQICEAIRNLKSDKEKLEVLLKEKEEEFEQKVSQINEMNEKLEKEYSNKDAFNKIHNENERLKTFVKEFQKDKENTEINFNSSKIKYQEQIDQLNSLKNQLDKELKVIKNNLNLRNKESMEKQKCLENLTENISLLKEANNDLKNQLDEKTLALKEKIENVTKIERNHDLLEEKLLHLVKEKSSIMEEFNKKVSDMDLLLNKKDKELNETRDKYDDRIKDLESKFTEKKNKIKVSLRDLSDQIALLQTEKSSLFNNLKAKESEIVNCKNENSNNLNKAEEMNTNLRLQLEELQTSHECNLAEQKTRHEATVSQFESERASLQHSLALKDENIVQLKREEQRLIETMDQGTEQHRIEMERLQEQLATREKEIDAQVQSMEQSNADLQRKIESLQNELSKLEDQFKGDSSGAEKRHEEEKQELKNKFESEKRSLEERLQSEKAVSEEALIAQNKNLEEQLQKLKEEFENQSRELAQQMEGFATEHTILNSRIKELEGKNDELKGQLSFTQKDAEEICKTLESISAQKEQLIDNKQKLTALKEDLEGQIHLLKEENLKVQEESEKAKVSASLEKHTLEERLQKNTEEHSLKYNDICQQKDEKITTMAQELDVLKEENMKYLSIVNQLQESNSDFNERLSSISTEKEELVVQMDQAKAKYIDDIQNLENKTQDLLAQKNDLESFKQSTQSSSACVASELAAVTEQLRKTKEENEENSKVVSELQTKIINVESALSAVQQEKDGLNASLNEIRSMKESEASNFESKMHSLKNEFWEKESNILSLNKKLEEEINTLRENDIKYTKEKNKFENELKLLSDSHTDKRNTDMIKTLETSLESQKNEFIEKEAKILENNKKLENEFLEKESGYISHQMELEEEINLFKEKDVKYTEEKAKLETELKNLKENSSEEEIKKCEQIKKLENDLDLIKKEFSDKEAGFLKEKKNLEADLHSVKENHSQNEIRITEERKNLESTMETLKKDHLDNEEKLKEEMNKLNNELQTMKNERSQNDSVLSQENNKLQSELQSMTEVHSQVSEELSKYKENHEESKKEIETLKNNSTNLQKQIECLNQASNDVASELASSKSKCNRLDMDVKEINNAKELLQNQLQDALSKITSLKGEKNDLISKLEVSQKDATFIERIPTLEKHICDLEASILSLTEKLENSRKEELRLQDSFSKTETKLKEEVSKRSQLEEAVLNIKTSSQNLCSRVPESEGIYFLKELLNALVSERDQAKKQCIDEQKAKEEVMGQLNQQIENVSCTNSLMLDKDHEIETINSKLKDLKEKLRLVSLEKDELNLKTASEKAALEGKMVGKLKEAENMLKAKEQTLANEHELKMKGMENMWQTRMEEKVLKREKELQNQMDLLSEEWNSERKELERLTQVAAAAFKTGSDSVDLLKKQVATQRKEIDEMKRNHRKEVNELQTLIDVKRRKKSGPGEIKVHTCLDEAAEFDYLRNILFEYMLGKETQTLSKVLCAVVKFDQNQQQQILDYEDRKQSLQKQFGTRRSSTDKKDIPSEVSQSR